MKQVVDRLWRGAQAADKEKSDAGEAEQAATSDVVASTPAAGASDPVGGAMDSGAVARDASGCEERQPEAPRADGGDGSPAAASCCLLEKVAGPSPLERQHGEAGDDIICRICFEAESTEDNPLLAPCKCSGSMRYIHRACLDQWRINCFNPKALVACTTCYTPFRVDYQGPGKDGDSRLWLRFARDVAQYVGVRIAGFLVAAVALGFWPQRWLGIGAVALHPNPVVSHLLCGSWVTFALVGLLTVGQATWAAGGWHTSEGLRLVLDMCPRRGGRGSGTDTIMAILIIIGVLCCLFILVQGIWRICNEGRHELVRAMKGANQEVRQKIVKEYVVLNFSEEEGPAEAVKEEGPLAAAS